MRRAVTARRMKEIVAQFRETIPGVTIRTTVLVGFPGETDAAFDNLLSFVEDAAFDRLGVFTYSVEGGTPAASMPDQVPADVMAARAHQVQDLQDSLAWERQKALYGTTQTVLVDGTSADPAFPFEGRTAGQAPEIDGVVYLRDSKLSPGRFAPGRFAEVRIVEVDGYELVGE
jgi:ribosomal protein S12 methylthiotransferase